MKKFIVKSFLTSLLFVMPTLANAEVSWYGQINRGLLSTNDGHEKNTFFVDSAYDDSLFGIKGTNKLNEEFAIGGNLEVWFMPNVSSGADDKSVSQLNKSGSSNNINFGVVDTWMESSNFGKISIGKGNMASKNTGTVTLSGTNLILYGSAADMAGGMYFHKQGDPGKVISTDPRVSGTFDPVSGLGIENRIRYDSNNFNGFVFSTSIGSHVDKDPNNNITSNKYCYDLALTHEKTFKAFQIKEAVAIAKYSKGGDTKAEKLYNASFSILHLDTGLNATAALGKKVHRIANPPITTPVNDKNKNFYYIQLGKQSDLFKYGKTNFAIDYWKAKNTNVDNDKARALGIGVVQTLNKINADLYFGVRNYKYEKPSQKYDKITAALFGFKIRFEGKFE